MVGSTWRWRRLRRRAWASAREGRMIDFDRLFARDLPPPAARGAGWPRYNFTGGHTAPEIVPVEGLIASAERVLRRAGRSLATYNQGGSPLGFAELRAFLAAKLAGKRGIEAAADDILITSGSLQGLDLVNEVLLERGDTVLMEQLTYSGAIERARRRGVSVVGVPLDERGLRTDQLATALESLRAERRAAQVHLHHPDHPEPDRDRPQPRAASGAAAPERRLRRAGLRGRVLRRSALGGRVASRAPRPSGRRRGDPHRLVLEDPGAGAPAGLRHRALGRAEPAARVQERRRHAGARADAGRGLFRRPFRRPRRPPQEGACGRSSRR